MGTLRVCTECKKIETRKRNEGYCRLECDILTVSRSLPRIRKEILPPYSGSKHKNRSKKPERGRLRALCELSRRLRPIQEIASYHKDVVFERKSLPDQETKSYSGYHISYSRPPNIQDGNILSQMWCPIQEVTSCPRFGVLSKRSRPTQEVTSHPRGHVISMIWCPIQHVPSMIWCPIQEVTSYPRFGVLSNTSHP
jgi:hypothetical protein